MTVRLIGHEESFEVRYIATIEIFLLRRTSLSFGLFDPAQFIIPPLLRPAAPCDSSRPSPIG